MLFHKLLFGKTAAEREAEAAQLVERWRRASSTEIAAKVKVLVAEEHQIELSTVTDELDFFKDLDDSLDFVELLMRCEEEFGLEIVDEDEAMAQISTVGELTGYILKGLGH